MTHSPSSPAKASREKPKRRRPWLLIFIFRLLLLGVGGGLALIGGIIFANFYPNPNPKPPLLLEGLESLDNKRPATSPTLTPTRVPDATNSLPQLTPIQKQQAQAQLTKLQAQLRALSDNAANLETQLGIGHPDETLETRLQAIAAQLQGVSAPRSKALLVGNGNANQAPANTESPSDTDKLKVTLPSDILFEHNNSLLRQEANLILDKVAADLRNYPASRIRIAAYTDATHDADANQELSFRRAKTVEHYLARTLGNQHRWLVIGYGETHPLTADDTDTTANQQRNRRIEIAVNSISHP